MRTPSRPTAPRCTCRPLQHISPRCTRFVRIDPGISGCQRPGNRGPVKPNGRHHKVASGTITATKVHFSSTMQNHHGGMNVADGCLYGANGGSEGGFLTCLDFQTGKLLWRDRQAPKGSLALADRRLYLRSEQGVLMPIEPRIGLVERGRFERPDRTNLPRAVQRMFHGRPSRAGLLMPFFARTTLPVRQRMTARPFDRGRSE